MKRDFTNFPVLLGLIISAFALPFEPPTLRAQAPWPYAPPPMMAPPTTPSAQRNALNEVRTQVRLLQNTTRTASSFSGGADNIWQQFQALRGSFNNFTMTLTSAQQGYAANELSELRAGLDIIQEAFANYNDDLAAGRSATAAYNDLGKVLCDASALWLQQLNKVCNRLRVGW